jgi:CheY-like chemotaxis protein
MAEQMKEGTQFILLDDDAINNVICRKAIQKIYPDAVLHEFQDPEKALAYIEQIFSRPAIPNMVMFLDINMPFMNGWEFLEALRKVNAPISQYLEIYILTTSIHASDKLLAKNNELVTAYIEKPFTVNIIQALESRVSG